MSRPPSRPGATLIKAAILMIVGVASFAYVGWRVLYIGEPLDGHRFGLFVSAVSSTGLATFLLSRRSASNT